jgi:hypothetical protein
MATTTYIPLAEFTLATASASVSITEISQDYSDLVLVVDWVSTNSVIFSMQFNGDVGSVYQNAYAYVTGGNATAGTSSQTKIRSALGIDNGERGLAIAQIQDYSATDKHKTVLTRVDSTDHSDTEMAAGRWPVTSAITSITAVTVAGGSYSAGTTFKLFGIHGEVV